MSSMQELNKAYGLLKSLKDKDKFDALAMADKLEALRLHTIQSIHNRDAEALSSRGGSDE